MPQLAEPSNHPIDEELRQRDGDAKRRMKIAGHHNVITPYTDTELADWYSADLRQVLDQHTPLTSREETNRLSAPWRTDSVRTAKRELRQGEHKWRPSCLTVY